jgi:hypothetical protein
MSEIISNMTTSLQAAATSPVETPRDSRPSHWFADGRVRAQSFDQWFQVMEWSSPAYARSGSSSSTAYPIPSCDRLYFLPILSFQGLFVKRDQIWFADLRKSCRIISQGQCRAAPFISAIRLAQPAHSPSDRDPHAGAEEVNEKVTDPRVAACGANNA